MKITAGSIVVDVKEQFYRHHDELPPTPTASGAQLLAVAGGEMSYGLYRSRGGAEPDKQIALNQAVELRDGDVFYALPPVVGG